MKTLLLIGLLILALIVPIADATNQCYLQCPVCKTKLVQAIAIMTTPVDVYYDIQSKQWGIGGYVGEYVYRCSEGHTWKCFENTYND